MEFERCGCLLGIKVELDDMTEICQPSDIFPYFLHKDSFPFNISGEATVGNVANQWVELLYGSISHWIVVSRFVGYLTHSIKQK